ncbi:MAG: nitrogen regulation protein NR(II) [Mariprofundaceae bacterium]
MQLDGIPITSVPLPLLLLNQKGFVQAANFLAQECLEISNQRLINQHLSEIFSPDSEVRRLLKRLAVTGEAVSNHCLHLGNANIPFTLHARPFADGVAVLLVAEAIRHEVNAYLKQKEMAEAVARIALEMAHEIKNPLAALRGAAQWLSERPESEDAKEATRMMMAEVDRISERVDDFLQLGTPSSAGMQLVNIHSMLEEVCNPIAEVHLQRVFDPGLPEIMVNSSRLRQAIENLWTNALEAGSRKIELHTRALSSTRLPEYNGPVIEILIVSDGADIPEQLIDHIFEPFVTGKQRGSGLGLAIVQRIMQEHDGRVIFDTKPGRTTFTLQLPLRGIR